MSIFSSFLLSLLLSIVLSFVAPMLLVGGILASIWLIGLIPGAQGYYQAIAAQISHFLATFGSGSPVHGLVVIGLTCSFVGALFDTYAFYRYQNLRGD